MKIVNLKIKEINTHLSLYLLYYMYTTKPKTEVENYFFIDIHAYTDRFLFKQTLAPKISPKKFPLLFQFLLLIIFFC